MDGAAAVADRYERLELIGEGAAARVYRARDRRSGALLALKVLSPQLRADPLGMERLRREIQITRHLNHPQIVRVFELLNEPDAPPMLAMELLEGRTLAQLAALEHPLALERVLAILRQLLEVLAACHARGVLHRDLKSRNVMIDDKDRITLLDFGIARMAALRDLTQTGTALGSPEYMAPELFASAAHDACTDLYAVGVIGVELLSGELPFQGDTLALLYRQHCERELPPLAERRPDAPPWLDALLRKLLDKHRHRRHQSAGEALADLAAQRVLARALPLLARRPCLACGEDTPLELPLCTACGQAQGGALAPGALDLHCAADAPAAALASFCERYLALRAPGGRRRGTLLLAGIDAPGAQRIRAAGARHGLYFELRPAARGPLARAVPAAALRVLFYCAAAPLALHWGWRLTWTALFRIGGTHALALAVSAGVFAHLGALAALCWGPFAALRAARARTPWLSRPAAQGELGTGAALAEQSWIAQRARAVAELRSAPLRAALGRLFESYLVLAQHGPAAAAALRERLQGLLDACIELAAIASELEQQLGDEAQRAQLLARWGADSAQLRALGELQDAHAAMLAALTAAQAGFNRALGQALALRGPIDEAELAIAGELLTRVADEWSARAELARALDARNASTSTGARS